jgi:hypothetical protein
MPVPHRRPARAALAAATAFVATAILATGPVAAHTGHEIGEYVIEIGWLHEPAYVAQPNAVQVTIVHHDDESPVTDLGPDDLAVTVSAAGVDGPRLALSPAFDAEEGIGPLGEYDAAIVPTAPGDYTFHLTGAIHGTAVDLTVTSGDETFDPVVAANDLEFPVPLPNLAEIGTRLDRIDARIATLQSADPSAGALDAAKAAADAAAAAAATADRAMLLGLGVGGTGVLLGLIGIALAIRARRSPVPGR